MVDGLSTLVKRAKENDLVKGLIGGRKEVEISYLLFVDDTILLLSKSDQNLRNLLIVLEVFCTT